MPCRLLHYLAESGHRTITPICIMQFYFIWGWESSSSQRCSTVSRSELCVLCVLCARGISTLEPLWTGPISFGDGQCYSIVCCDSIIIFRATLCLSLHLGGMVLCPRESISVWDFYWLLSKHITTYWATMHRFNIKLKIMFKMNHN